MSRCTAMQQDKHTSNEGLRQQLLFEVFTGSNCETMKIVSDNKLNDSDYKSEKDEIP